MHCLCIYVCAPIVVPMYIYIYMCTNALPMYVYLCGTRALPHLKCSAYLNIYIHQLRCQCKYTFVSNALPMHTYMCIKYVTRVCIQMYVTHVPCRTSNSLPICTYIYLLKCVAYVYVYMYVARVFCRTSNTLCIYIHICICVYKYTY